MKRTIAVLICLLLVASFAISAFALETVQLTMSADKTSVKRGEIVEFTVSIPATACTAASVYLDGKFDAAVFEFVDGSGHLPNIGDVNVEDAADLPAGFSYVGLIDEKLIATFMNMTETTTSGEIFNIRMKVKDDAAFGETTIAPVVALRNAAGEITATINALNVTVVCNHEWSAWTKVDSDTHARTCSICGANESENHSFTEKVFDDAHKVPGTEAEYYFDCAHCDMMGTETFDGSYKSGDLNADDVVDKQDAIYLLRHVLFHAQNGKYPVNQPVDYTKDDTVDKQDAIYLLRHVLFHAQNGKYPLT